MKVAFRYERELLHIKTPKVQIKKLLSYKQKITSDEHARVEKIPAGRTCTSQMDVITAL